MNNNDIWWLQWWLPRWRVLLVFPYHKQATMSSLQCYLIRWGATCVAEAFLNSPNKLTAIIKMSHESEWRYRQSIDVDCELATSDPDQFMLYPTVNYKHCLKCNLSFPTKFLTLLYFIICRLTKSIRCNV